MSSGLLYPTPDTPPPGYTTDISNAMCPQPNLSTLSNLLLLCSPCWLTTLQMQKPGTSFLLRPPHLVHHQFIPSSSSLFLEFLRTSSFPVAQTPSYDSRSRSLTSLCHLLLLPSWIPLSSQRELKREGKKREERRKRGRKKERKGRKEK